MDRAIDRVELTAYGERGLLIQVRDEVDGPEVVVNGWAEAVRAARLPGVVDIVPAARSVLLHLADGVRPQQVRDTIAGLQPLSVASEDDLAIVEIEVTYDGPDLDDVAIATGRSVAEVVAAHTGTLWRAAFVGFAPGFAYLTSADNPLAVPRRSEPRTRVPAGAVALAAGYSAVYPRSSPGGWQLIGHTDRAMWVPSADPPALLTPGRSVRFVARSR